MDYFPDNLETVEREEREERKPRQPGASMRPTTFTRTVASEVERRLKEAGIPANIEARWRLVKFWYGEDSSIHYELSLHENGSQLEIGLHAESTPERNRVFYEAFDKCMVEIQLELGNTVWLEEWDRGWVRLYETLPLWPLDDSRAVDVAERIVEMISVIEPIYRAIL